MYNENIGNKVGLNTKQKLSYKRMNNEFDYKSDDFKKTISRVTSGSNNGMYGKKGENAINGKMVVMYNDNQEAVQSFVSVAEALKFLGIKGHVGLNNACRNGLKYHNHYWKKEWI